MHFAVIFFFFDVTVSHPVEMDGSEKCAIKMRGFDLFR